MRVFRKRLGEMAVPLDGRRWVYVPYDQLSLAIGPLSREDPRELGVVLVESPWKARRRPYHQQKLALVLANQRRFALEVAERGIAVRYEVADAPYGEVLAPLARELGPMRHMRPAERELRQDLAPLVAKGQLLEIEHEGWLTTRAAFDGIEDAQGRWRMDAFYRRVRQETGILMSRGRPVGGKLSFDSENRRPWSGDPPAPPLPTFDADPVKDEVMDLVRERFGDHPGTLDPAAIPTSAADAARLWSWAQENCLVAFGPYEDAMSTQSTNLFHTRISSLLNLHRLLPADVVRDVEALGIPLGSKEGFIRQVLGWREFVHHVHEATDGFRRDHGGGEAGASPSHLGARGPLPPAYWEGAPSGLHCLDTVVRSVWQEGYSHHITRLMILSNLATLLDISPRELTDWFWVAYTDAYDWVVEPNVLGMGTFALGPLFTTKPYVSGAAYINRMSDYCRTCAFDPKTTCPITRLYWAFLARHASALEATARMAMPLRSLAQRKVAEKGRDEATFHRVRGALEAGECLSPEASRD